MKNSKRMPKLFLTCFVISFLLNGCVSVPKVQRPFEKSKIFNIPFEEAWEIINRTIVEPGVTIKMVKKQIEEGHLSFKKSVSSQMIKEVALAPSGGVTWYGAEADIDIIVNEYAEDQTQVVIHVNIRGSGLRKYLFFLPGSYVWLEMGSTGALEAEYFRKISDALEEKK
jgi:hypothetical protein